MRTYQQPVLPSQARRESSVASQRQLDLFDRRLRHAIEHGQEPQRVRFPTLEEAQADVLLPGVPL